MFFTVEWCNSQGSTEIWKWSVVESRNFPKATQYYIEMSSLKRAKDVGHCFGVVVEVSGIRGVGDKWSKCPERALTETPAVWNT